MWSIGLADPGRGQEHHRDRGRRSRSAARSTASPPTRVAARRAPTTRTSSPTSPPIHTEPEARCSQSKAIVSPRGEVWPGARRRRGRAAPRRPPAARRWWRPARRSSDAARSGRSTRSAIQPATQNRAKQSSRSTYAAPERGHPEQRHERAQIEHRAQRVVGGGEVQVDGNRDQPDQRGDHERDRQRPQARTPGTARPAGRAISSRRASRPIGAITDDEHQPARDQQLGRDRGRRDARDLELGRRARVGPDRVGEGPLDRVAVDRDRAPVDQVPALEQPGPQRARRSVSGFDRRALRRPGGLLRARRRW